MFAKMLEQVVYHYEKTSSQALSLFISELIAKPLPQPGETFEVNIAVSKTQVEKWRFTRPNEEDSLFEHVSYKIN